MNSSTPDWDVLNARPIPAWFDEAKFGIFIHWGVYSVPAWSPKGTYSEWYWHSMQDKNGPTWKFHEKIYGADFQYQDFAPMFKADLFEPARWADLFARSGARYVTLTGKHHDGYCLWPSAYSWNWNSVDVGPHRDLVGELAEAVRARNLRMCLYYSLYEWFRPLYLENPERYAVEHMIPQLKEVISKYEPSLLYTDGEWDHPSEVWHSREFLAWLFNESLVRDEIVVNDRWGEETRSSRGGYFTTEYGKVCTGKTLAPDRKWEEIRGIGESFGYNRNEDLEDYLDSGALIRLLADTVGKGGNLNINVGPTADGRIPVIMQERLLQMGDWLDVNGEAIYGSKVWRVTGEGENIRYTSKNGAIYAIVLGAQKDAVVLTAPKPEHGATARLLGAGDILEWSMASEGIRIQTPLDAGLNSCSRETPRVIKLDGFK
jgi:alpha-L-fucosidase